MHLELRVCPALHTLEGLTQAEALDAVREGFSEGMAAAPGRIEGGVIITILRSLGVDHAEESVALAADFADSGVLGPLP